MVHDCAFFKLLCALAYISTPQFRVLACSEQQEVCTPKTKCCSGLVCVRGQGEGAKWTYCIKGNPTRPALPTKAPKFVSERVVFRQKRSQQKEWSSMMKAFAQQLNANLTFSDVETHPKAREISLAHVLPRRPISTKRIQEMRKKWQHMKSLERKFDHDKNEPDDDLA